MLIKQYYNLVNVRLIQVQGLRHRKVVKNMIYS